jgi:hypothetical protein
MWNISFIKECYYKFKFFKWKKFQRFSIIFFLYRSHLHGVIINLSISSSIFLSLSLSFFSSLSLYISLLYLLYHNRYAWDEMQEMSGSCHPFFASHIYFFFFFGIVQTRIHLYIYIYVRYCWELWLSSSLFVRSHARDCVLSVTIGLYTWTCLWIGACDRVYEGELIVIYIRP